MAAGAEADRHIVPVPPPTLAPILVTVLTGHLVAGKTAGLEPRPRCDTAANGFGFPNRVNGVMS